MTVLVDVRVDRAGLISGSVAPRVLGLSRLLSIDMQPPSAGPEVELTFGPYGRSGIEEAERLTVERVTDAGATVLACRVREGGWRLP